jgi:transcription elongation factor Elf1
VGINLELLNQPGHSFDISNQQLYLVPNRPVLSPPESHASNSSSSAVTFNATTLPHLLPDHLSATHAFTNSESKMANYNTWTCNPCGRSFGSRHAIEQHNDDKHTYWCDVCKDYFVFLTKEEDDDHDRLCHRFPCTFGCDRTFATTGARDQHNEALHSHYCEECEEYFSTEKDLDEHDEAYHSYYCGQCDEHFSTEEDFDEHDAAYHAYSCFECERGFSSATALAQHESSSAHPHRCSVCSKAFAIAANLRNHIAATHIYRCDKCAMTYNDAKALQLHKKSEHEPMKCTKCFALLKNKAEMDKHIKSSHTFRCPHCGHIFEEYANLQSHISANHTLHCQTCGGTFGTVEALKTHQEQGHSMRCTSSRDCMEKFATLSDAIQHYIKEHTYRCEHCPGAVFTTIASQKNHISMKHADSHVSEGGYSSRPSTLASPTPATKQQPARKPRSTESKDSYSPVKDQASLANASLKCQPSTSVTQNPNSSPMYKCEECDDANFTSQAEFDQHMLYSPFHGKPELKCYECGLSYTNQIALLEHIESKPHNVRWVLSMIRTK